MSKAKTVEGFVIRAVELNRSEGKITLDGVRDTPGMVSHLFQEMAGRNIDVNLIVQNSGPAGDAHVTFTVRREQLEAARTACEAVREKLGATAVEADANIATVSVIGVGMRSHTDVAARMFAALARANVNIDLISTSEIEIECVVRESEACRAHQALLQEFHPELE
ncbi:MAG: ACT domain-containing protein [Planctomycetes bacterium]|nr:ACT domain-containing protein [Planctomycetota bacterium]